MIVVKNNSKKVLVLKALGVGVLRLLPGFNNVDLKDLSVFTKGNKAATAVVKEHLSIVDSGALDAEEKKLAKAAKEKNDKLNKSAIALKAAQANLLKAEEKITSEAVAMGMLKESNNELKGQLAELQAQMKELMAQKPAPEKVAAPAKAKAGDK